MKKEKRVKIEIHGLRKEDKKLEELAQYFLDENYDKFGDFIESIVVARVSLETAYPMIKGFGDGIWDKILSEGVKLVINEKMLGDKQ